MLSNGYEVASGDAKPFELLPPQSAPDGSLSITGADMARFMIAHLQNGKYGETRILQAQTAETMHARQFAMDPAVNGMAFGFYEENRNGHHIVGHGGDTINQALHLVRFGHDVAYLTVLGTDPFAGPMRAAWGREGMDTSLVLTDPDRATGLYAISIDAHGERRFSYWRSDSAARRSARGAGRLPRSGRGRQARGAGSSTGPPGYHFNRNPSSSPPEMAPSNCKSEVGQARLTSS